MKCLRRFWSSEIAPALEGNSPALWLTCALGTAVLMNKRYLCDRGVVPDPETRWQIFAAWQFACLWLLLIAAKVRRPLPAAVVAFLGGVVILGLVMVPSQLTSPGARQLSPPWTSTPWLMLVLAWCVAAPAGIAARAAADQRRTWPAVLLMIFSLAIVGLVLWCPKAIDPLLHDARYDKFNWGLLTVCWLCLNPAAMGLGLLGRSVAKDGFGLGRLRFWVPWTGLFLAFMLLVVVQFAGRQPGFEQYYPMFRPDWFAYDPELHGWWFFVIYEATYVVYFLGWEFFFRGFMLFRLEPEFGAKAILIQAVPFALMHINKPPLEFHSSLLAGIVLGWLAWRSRSFWPCFLLHAGVAVTMDLTALVNRPA